MTKYQAFISSTVLDLEDARLRTASAINALEIFEAIRSEVLPASEMPSRAACLEEVRLADIVVLLLGTRYGFVPISANPEKLSVTHMEYREAKRLRKPVFAFILDAKLIDEPLRALLNEVEDFDSGVFRKKWTSPLELADQVRRSLLWWVARMARNNIPQPTNLSSIVLQIGQARIGDIQYHLRGSAGCETFLSWLRVQLENLRSAQDRPGLLPSLRETAGRGDASVLVDVEVSEAPQQCIVSVQVNLPGQKKADLRLEVAANASGASLLRQTFRAFVYLLAEDPGTSIDVLLRQSRRSDVPDGARAALIALAVRIAMAHGLDRAVEAGESLRGLSGVGKDAFTTVLMALFETAIRFHSKKLREAERRVGRLCVALLAKSLQEGIGGPEEIYTLARKTLEADLDVAAELYLGLLEIHPYYQERWYWHRDLGLYYYHRNNFQQAAYYYDTAANLNPKYARLFRFAGDAYFYQGKWAIALERFRVAVGLEHTETYLLDTKIAFARGKVSAGVAEQNHFLFRRRLGWRLACYGALLATRKATYLSKLVFRCVLRLDELNYEATRWLALYANRRGEYRIAIRMLFAELTAVPENAAARLNLAANLIFEGDGKITETAKANLSAAIFNGGPRTRERFELLLTNTPNRAALLSEFDSLLRKVGTEWEDAERRRLEIVNSGKFGDAHHFEV